MDMAGIVWRTTDEGNSWVASLTSSEPIRGIHKIDSLDFLGVGGDLDGGSATIRTKDGGESWQYSYLGIRGETLSLTFRTPYEGYATQGFPCTYMATYDTGRTWQSFRTSDTTVALYDITFTDSLHGFMTGANGSIFRYNPSIVAALERHGQLPTAVTLHQNYPNPFNPVTRITYDIPVSSNVTLRVYDILGREVKTLVNGSSPAGSYSIQFDGSDLASGVYFYQLETTAQNARTIIHRRMALVK
jgi:hypothetical protein